MSLHAFLSVVDLKVDVHRKDSVRSCEVLGAVGGASSPPASPRSAASLRSHESMLSHNSARSHGSGRSRASSDIEAVNAVNVSSCPSVHTPHHTPGESVTNQKSMEAG